MFKYFVPLCLSLLVINSAINSCEGFSRGYSANSQRVDKNNAQTTPTNSMPGSEEAPARKGLRLSAWGIVAVVVSIILAIMGMYFFSICYPVVCLKNRQYDMMGPISGV